MVKKKCELCCGVARMFCESDQASLCWNCDGKVHGANFLVAKHTRCLLCSVCQSPTPWKASGLRLCPTLSICESCVARKKNSVGVGDTRNTENLTQHINGRGFGGDRLRREEEDDDAESYNDDEEETEEEEEAENQVVPWDAAAAAQQPPLVSSSSSVNSGEEVFSGNGGLVVKRTRRDLDLNCSDEESNVSRPVKRVSKERHETSSRSTAMKNSILRLHGAKKSNGC